MRTVKSTSSPGSQPSTKEARTKAEASKVPAGELPTMAFADARAFATWLAEHHATSRGVWLRLAKKASGAASVTYAKAIEVALVWGWIDGQKRPGDATSWLQKFSPRGARSTWSKINREKATALIAAGAMQPPGLAEVERAQRDGRWDAAYDAPSCAAVPADLAAALAANPRAAAFFATLDAANRYSVLFRIQTVKKPETRAKRIEHFVAMLARHETIHDRPRRAPKG
ncbi:MAG TPA: YdeI/OmpD-associated family protein [Minicystis sp.]|nr:YdeI/OmpD-associated family protein [Minicystis sp.]